MYLFLDIDGVLNTFQSHESWDKKPEAQTSIKFDTRSVDNLNLVLDRFPTLSIVISSSWRNTLPLEKIRNVFAENGIKRLPDSVTPNNAGRDRGEEILGWFQENPGHQGEPYLVLDDNILDITPHISEECLVHITNGWVTGFTREHAETTMEKIIQLSLPGVSAPT